MNICKNVFRHIFDKLIYSLFQERKNMYFRDKTQTDILLNEYESAFENNIQILKSARANTLVAIHSISCTANVKSSTNIDQ